MRMIAALTIAGMAVPAAAQADDARTAHHVQCFIATALLVESDDREIQTAGLMASMFFAGQIFGADPDIDLEAAAKAEMASMTPDGIVALQRECGAEMDQRGKEIIAVGEALQEDAASPSTT